MLIFDHYNANINKLIEPNNRDNILAIRKSKLAFTGYDQPIIYNIEINNNNNNNTYDITFSKINSTKKYNENYESNIIIGIIANDIYNIEDQAEPYIFLKYNNRLLTIKNIFEEIAKIYELSK